MIQFDPSYGYTLDMLLAVPSPETPKDFVDVWSHYYHSALSIKPQPKVKDTGREVGDFSLHQIEYQSTDEVTIRGWLLKPKTQDTKRVCIVGHGYGGCEQPSDKLSLPMDDCAYLFICYRGISESRIEGVPEDPNYHVLYNIHDRDQYIIKGCVEDTWLAVSAAQALFPSLNEHIGFMGISFSGGIGALAIAADQRIKLAHLEVPTFGNQALRLELPSTGSANAVQSFAKSHPDVIDTLAYYDAAIAARSITIPMHIAAALADPVVAPPGQFSIYNELSTNKKLFVLEKGHSDYENYQQQQDELLAALTVFFKPL